MARNIFENKLFLFLFSYTTDYTHILLSRILQRRSLTIISIWAYDLKIRSLLNKKEHAVRKYKMIRWRRVTESQYSKENNILSPTIVNIYHQKKRAKILAKYAADILSFFLYTLLNAVRINIIHIFKLQILFPWCFSKLFRNFSLLECQITGRALNLIDTKVEGSISILTN